MMSRKPIVLISAEDGIDPMSGLPHLVPSARYGEAVARAGGIPAFAADIRAAKEYVDQTDALLLSDGPVIHPARYGQIFLDFSIIRGFSRTRDDLDFRLAELFLASGKPVVGLGRGLLVVNALLGGTIRLADDVWQIDRQADDLYLSEAGVYRLRSGRFLGQMVQSPVRDAFIDQTAGLLREAIA